MRSNLFPTLPKTPAYRYVRATDKLPKIGTTADESDPLFKVKLFSPDGGWYWFISECGTDDDPDLCFGLVKGFETELGYFSLAELREVRGAIGLPIERDIHFKPTRRSELGPRFS